MRRYQRQNNHEYAYTWLFSPSLYYAFRRTVEFDGETIFKIRERSATLQARRLIVS